MDYLASISNFGRTLPRHKLFWETVKIGLSRPSCARAASRPEHNGDDQ